MGTRGRFRLCVALLASVAGGCGGDDVGGDGGDRASLGIDRERLLTDLSVGELAQLCEVLEGRVLQVRDGDEGARRGACLFGGDFADSYNGGVATDQVCAPTQEQCMAVAAESQAPRLRSCEGPPSASCDATVGTLEDCVDFNSTALHELGEAGSCDAFFARPDVVDIVLPAEDTCGAIADRCMAVAP